MKTIKKIISFILLTAILSSMCVNYAFASENKYTETEYLKQFISEEYIVDDKEIQIFERTGYPGHDKYKNYFRGYHSLQGGDIYIYFSPANQNQEFLEKYYLDTLNLDDVKNELGKYFNLENSSYYYEISHPYKTDSTNPFELDYDKYEILIRFKFDWNELSALDRYYLRAKLYLGIAMSLEANGALESENGVYMHCGDPMLGGESYGQGDINLDGKTGVRDMLLLKKYIAGMSPRVFIESCDINGDGNINAVDTIRLKKLLVGA